MHELVLLDGTERRYKLPEGSELTIGAAASCAVRLQAADVSRKHALLTCQRGTIVLLDLGSTNGTFVNGKPVKEAELKSGDAIRFSSVIAHILPEASASGAVSGEAAERSAPSPVPEKLTTSDRMPVILQESLIWLLSRWGVPNGNAVAVLAEWFVVCRGMSAAAVLEQVGNDVSVVAAYGAVRPVLDDPRSRALLRTPVPPGSTVESVQITLGGEKALAVKGADVPWLLLVCGDSTPEAGELELFVRLLAVALRLAGAPVVGG